MGGDLKVDQQAGPRQHVPADRWSSESRRAAAPAQAQTRQAGRRRCACSASRTIPTAASCMNAILRELGHRVELRRQRRGGGRGGRARRLRRRADGRRAARHRRHRGDAAHPRAAGAGRPHPDHRRFRPHRARATTRPRGRRHECLSAQAGSPAELNEALGRVSAQARRISRMTSSRITAPIVASMIDADDAAADADAELAATASCAMNAPTMPMMMSPIRPKPDAAHDQAGEPAGDRADDENDQDCFNGHDDPPSRLAAAARSQA